MWDEGQGLHELKSTPVTGGPDKTLTTLLSASSLHHTPTLTDSSARSEARSSASIESCTCATEPGPPGERDEMLRFNTTEASGCAEAGLVYGYGHTAVPHNALYAFQNQNSDENVARPLEWLLEEMLLAEPGLQLDPAFSHALVRDPIAQGQHALVDVAVEDRMCKRWRAISRT